jgi:hypothetical protein
VLLAAVFSFFPLPASADEVMSVTKDSIYIGKDHSPGKGEDLPAQAPPEKPKDSQRQDSNYPADPAQITPEVHVYVPWYPMPYSPPGFQAPPPGYPPGRPGQMPAYPGQRPPYFGQKPSYPGQKPSYPGQRPPSFGQKPPYPGQMSPYPGQRPSYPGQRPPYPGQMSPYPGQRPPYPGQPRPVPGQHAPPYQGGKAPFQQTRP